MTVKYQTLEIERPCDEIAVVRINRPDRFNAMTMTMFDELAAYPRELDKDDKLRVVILTGAGDYFCAGFDLSEMDEMFEMDVRDFLVFQEKTQGGGANCPPPPNGARVKVCIRSEAFTLVVVVVVVFPSAS